MTTTSVACHLKVETKVADVNLLRKSNPIAWAYKITIYVAIHVALAEQVGYALTADEAMVKKLKGDSIVVSVQRIRDQK
jgi:predicted nucleic acid-binding protein